MRLPCCDHRHQVSSSQAHNSNTRGNHKVCSTAGTKQAQKTNKSSCKIQTHKVKRINARRELHSLQVNDSIDTLCTSSSGQQLPRTQQQRARQPQALHALQHQMMHKKKQQQRLQHANSLVEASECPEGTALLARY